MYDHKSIRFDSNHERSELRKSLVIQRAFFLFFISYMKLRYENAKCIACGWETVSVIKTEEGYICYNCYSDKKEPSKKKKQQHNRESTGFSRSFSARFLYSFLICRIDFFLQSRTVAAGIK